MKHTFDPGDVKEKVTVFVRCMTEEKLEYVNLFGSLTKKSSKEFFDALGLQIISGIRKVFENNCTYVTLVRSKECSDQYQYNTMTIPSGISVGIAQKVKPSKDELKQISTLDIELGNRVCEG